MAGQRPRMVEVSWIEKPAGRSSACIALRMPPRLGVWPYAGSSRTSRRSARTERTRRMSVLLQAHVFERRRPRIRIDQHERGLGHPGPDPAGPDVLEDGCDAHALVHELLDLVQ